MYSEDPSVCAPLRQVDLMLIILFSSVWLVITVVAAVIAYASRTGPDDALKNISQWLERGGVKDAEIWIGEHWKRRKLRVIGGVGFLSLLVVEHLYGGHDVRISVVERAT